MTTLGLLVCLESVQEETERTKRRQESVLRILGLCSADPKLSLIRFFFHPEQYFPLTDSAVNSKIQPLPCFFMLFVPCLPVLLALHFFSHLALMVHGYDLLMN